jgi:uncharacterized protein
MRNIIKCLFLFCLIPLFGLSQTIPERSLTLVTDYTNTLQPQELQALESKLVAFNDSTSTQIAIVILSSLDGYPINDYAQKLGEKWGIGNKGKNNGAIILVALNDHKVSIQTGYGLEGAIPDALAKRIVDNDITPAFKQQAYYQGLDAATSTMISLAKGEYTADDYMKKHGHRKDGQGFPPFMLFIILGIILIVGFSKYRSVSSYATTNNLSFWVAFGLLNAAANSGSGRWNNFSGGSGGFGGGDSGGGGFGGFGGGSFGGGGASGSW